MFALLTANTYDPDEFVILQLAGDFAHGATPYHSFMFFHPPGILVLFRLLQPLTSFWWPIGRVVIMLADSLTALCVWRIGTLLYTRREALAAGLLYGASPLALICGVRVGQDPLVTSLGLVGLTILLSNRRTWGATVAGICLGLAVWIKYPAILFLPVYVLAAPRRAAAMLVSAAATAVVVFAPFVHEARALYDQTVGWQTGHRKVLGADHRIASVFTFWILLNPLAIPAIFRRRQPAWLLCGFGVGGAFLLASQAYYHYFVPVIPFAALLAAPMVARIVRRSSMAVMTAAIMLVVLWAGDIDFGSSLSRFFITASSLSSVNQTVEVLEHTTYPRQRILTDQLEYAYLAGRPAVADYFWNMQDFTKAPYLEARLHNAGAVVLTRGIDPTYPAGLTRYLKLNAYRHITTPSTEIWIFSRRGAGSAFLAAINSCGLTFHTDLELRVLDACRSNRRIIAAQSPSATELSEAEVRD